MVVEKEAYVAADSRICLFLLVIVEQTTPTSVLPRPARMMASSVSSDRLPNNYVNNISHEGSNEGNELENQRRTLFALPQIATIGAMYGSASKVCPRATASART